MTYEELREIARLAWIATREGIPCYVQKVHDWRWRVSCPKGIMLGYIDIDLASSVGGGL